MRGVRIAMWAAGCLIALVLGAWCSAVAQPYEQMRSGPANALVRLASGEHARVAFLGGSITRMTGWRNLVMEDLERRFPDTDIRFVQAGIPSMGSTPGAFRLSRDVFPDGPVDLLFVEAAVNDSTNGRSAEEQIRGMEGIVRHARRLNPAIDIVFMYFVDPEKMEAYRAGATPDVIVNHERVAAHYEIPSLNLALEVTERIDAGEFTWEDDFKDLHPAPFGHRLYADSIARLLDSAWSDAPAEAVRPHVMPAALDDASYDRGRIVDVVEATSLGGFRVEPDWSPTDGAATRPGFTNCAMLVGERPGSSFAFEFEGNAVGLWIAAGPDAGTIAYRIDDGPERVRDLYTQWSGQLHLPWAHVLGSGLEDGPHLLRVRVLEGRNEASTGSAVRVAHFLVNGG